MNRIVLLPMLVLLLAVLPARGEKKEYRYRWVRVNAGLRDNQDVEKIRTIARTAASHGLNGILLSAGLDQLDLKTPDYFRRLEEIRDFCRELKLEIIPSFMSSGYGGAVLSHDRNLAAGLPVRDALYIVRGGKGRFEPDPKVEIANGGFERHVESRPEGFTLASRPGDVISVDSAVAREGRASIRFENLAKFPREAARLSVAVEVRPYRQYRLRCWVKSENLGSSNPFGSGNFQLDVLGGEEKRPLQYQNPRFSTASGEWQRVAVGFNSWGYHRVEIAARVRGAAEGRFWIDSLELEEVGLVNVLRRPGTPVIVKSERTGAAYEEGRDFARILDPQLDFRYDHEGPDIDIPAGSRISEGERLRVSYYHGTNIYNGQTPICMSEPKLYEIWKEQVRLVHKVLAPNQYLLNMDEVRTGGSCEACTRRGLSMGEIFADAVTQQYRMIREVNPKAEVFVWSDMLDPNHNANPGRKFYYLAEGTFENSWKHVPKELIIVCWYFEKRNASLRHFSGLGFRTIAGAYYDADDMENPKAWMEALDATPGACGILYTTWLNKYDLLGAFGDLVSGSR